MKISQNSISEQFQGTKKVFSFTLSQFFKNKANLISFIILFVMCIVSAPLSSLIGGSGSTTDIYDNVEQVPTQIYIYNTTGIELTENNDFIKSSPFSNCQYLSIPSIQSLPLNETEVLFEIHFNQNSYCYEVTAKLSESTSLENSTVSALQYTISQGFELEKYNVLGMDAETAMSILQSGYVGSVSNAEDFANKDNQSFEVKYTVQMIYSIIILMLCTLSSSYIIRTVVEEKSSKLVELLLVSVRPLALLAGKILAIMVCVMCMILLMISGTVLSNYISTEYLGLEGFTAILESTGISFDLLNLGWELALIVIISVVLSYLTFSIISGISGACCTSMDEMSSASLLSVVPAIIGYMSAPILSTFESKTVDTIASLMPIISSFYAPSAYLLGNISLGVMIASLIIQGITAIVLALFCKRVYSYIIMYKGTKLNLKALFSIAGLTSIGKEND